MRDEIDIGAYCFAGAVKLLAGSIKTSTKLIDEIINEEKYKEKLRNQLNILEYAEIAKSKKSFYTPNEAEEERLVEIIKRTDPNFDKELFEQYAEGVLRIIQQAYCDKEFDSLRKIVDTNIIDQFKVQTLNTIGLKEEIKVDTINYVDFFGFHKEGKTDVLSVAIGVKYYDYFTNEEGEIVGGSDKIKKYTVYLLSFSRKIGGKTIKNIRTALDGFNYCPNCGGKITSLSNECEYCHTILFNSTDNWLLTHIEEM